MAATVETPLCHECSGELKRFVTNKPGPNCGRAFYTCKGYANGGNCKLEKGVFVWETNDGKFGSIADYVESYNRNFSFDSHSQSSSSSSSSSSSQKRPRVEPASSLPRQERHVTHADLDAARLLSRLEQIEQKIDQLAALIRDKLEEEESPASQAQTNCVR